MLFGFYFIGLVLASMVKLLVWLFALPVKAFVAFINALDRHNRRRSTRQAFLRAQQKRNEFYAAQAPRYQQWPPPEPPSQPWRYGVPNPSPVPQDNPYWRPNGR